MVNAFLQGFCLKNVCQSSGQRQPKRLKQNAAIPCSLDILELLHDDPRGNEKLKNPWVAEV